MYCKVVQLLPFTAGVLIFGGCTAYERVDSNKSGSSDAKTALELPLLRAVSIPPIANADQFHHLLDAYIFNLPKANRDLPSEPFTNDEDAINAAREWIRVHFGSLNSGAALEVTEIFHSLSRARESTNERDRGHTIEFCETYLGTATDRHATIRVAGPDRIYGRIELSQFVEISNSARKVVSSDEATQKYLKLMKSKEGQEGRGATNQIVPMLIYQFSILHAPRDERFDTDILAPSWVFDNNIVVDGFTGKLWRDD